MKCEQKSIKPKLKSVIGGILGAVGAGAWPYKGSQTLPADGLVRQHLCDCSETNGHLHLRSV